MNGERYLLDTNALIYLLAGTHDVTKHIQQATWLGISVVSQLEFLSFSSLSDRDQQLFADFIARVEVVSLEARQTALLSMVIDIRRTYNLKLPDAIIAATAQHYRATLISSDKHFREIPNLNVIIPKIR